LTTQNAFFHFISFIHFLCFAFVLIKTVRRKNGL